MVEKVSDLVKRLQELPQDAEIIIAQSETDWEDVLVVILHGEESRVEIRIS